MCKSCRDFFHLSLISCSTLTKFTCWSTRSFSRAEIFDWSFKSSWAWLVSLSESCALRKSFSFWNVNKVLILVTQGKFKKMVLTQEYEQLGQESYWITGLPVTCYVLASHLQGVAISAFPFIHVTNFVTSCGRNSQLAYVPISTSHYAMSSLWTLIPAKSLLSSWSLKSLGTFAWIVELHANLGKMEGSVRKPALIMMPTVWQNCHCSRLTAYFQLQEKYDKNR